MAGYHGYSMSNNAVAAYEEGQRPKSGWTKDAILRALPEDKRPLAAELKADELRSLALAYAGWHHTGKLYNCTDFYEVVPDEVTPEAVAAVKAARTPKAPVMKERAVRALVAYECYEGPYRAWRKWVKYEDIALVVGRWAYFRDGSKKDLKSSHVWIEDRYARAPKGTADTFREIWDRMPKAVKERTVY